LPCRNVEAPLLVLRSSPPKPSTPSPSPTISCSLRRHQALMAAAVDLRPGCCCTRRGARPHPRRRPGNRRNLRHELVQHLEGPRRACIVSLHPSVSPAPPMSLPPSSLGRGRADASRRRSENRPGPSDHDPAAACGPPMHVCVAAGPAKAFSNRRCLPRGVVQVWAESGRAPWIRPVPPLASFLCLISCRQICATFNLPKIV
jgi:hypothetical protein